MAGVAVFRLGGVEEGLVEHTVTCFMPDPPLLLPGHKAGDIHPCWARPQGTPTPARLGSRGNQPLLGQADRDEFIFGVGDLQGQVAFSTWQRETTHLFKMHINSGVLMACDNLCIITYLQL